MLINPGASQDQAPEGKAGVTLVLELGTDILQLQHNMLYTADNIEHHSRWLLWEFIQGQGLEPILPSFP